MINSIIKNLKVNHDAFKNNKKFKVSKILKKLL